MRLIDFRGLNCYTNGLVSVANDWGIDYRAAFAALWSETEFDYQPDREVYLSRRLPDALGALGARLIMQLCDGPGQAEARLRELGDGEPAIIGMDAHFVPWSEFYGLFHGPHFFVGRLEAGGGLICFDPTFQVSGAPLSRDAVIAHAYDISRIARQQPGPPPPGPLADAGAILRGHPDLKRALLGRIRGGEALRAAKYVDALLNNRYLYRHGLPDGPRSLMDDGLLSRWAALKGGLYKLAIAQNGALLDEVCALAERLIDEEMKIAGHGICHGKSSAESFP